MSGPQVVRQLAEDQKPVDLTATLLEQRMVFYSDEVNSETANRLIKQLLYLAAISDDPITLYINSPGGSVVDGMGIYDTIQRIKAPVHAVVCGMAASMGAVILSGCEKSHRMVLPHAEVLLHQPLGGARGPATDIQISAQRILKTKQTLLQILADNCGHSYEKLVEDCDRDFWLDAEDAVEYGIADGVLK